MLSVVGRYDGFEDNECVLTLSCIRVRDKTLLVIGTANQQGVSSHILFECYVGFTYMHSYPDCPCVCVLVVKVRFHLGSFVTSHSLHAYGECMFVCHV